MIWQSICLAVVRGFGLGSACGRKLIIQGDAGGRANMLGCGNIGNCWVKSWCERMSDCEWLY
jgi:hypothetical protein